MPLTSAPASRPSKGEKSLTSSPQQRFALQMKSIGKPISPSLEEEPCLPEMLDNHCLNDSNLLCQVYAVAQENGAEGLTGSPELTLDKGRVAQLQLYRFWPSSDKQSFPFVLAVCHFHHLTGCQKAVVQPLHLGSTAPRDASP